MARSLPHKRSCSPTGTAHCLAGLLALSLLGCSFRRPDAATPGAEEGQTFAGSSERLEHTVVVPTLDTPVPAGKSAVWCSSFQIAWNRFNVDVAGEPVRLDGAETTVERLNRAKQSDKDLAPEDYLAVAGRVNDGIVDRIHQDMARKFPGVPQPRLVGWPGGAIAYAYLQAGIKYRYEYFDNPEPLLFTDSAGQRTPVRSFGLGPNERSRGHQTFRAQALVLFRDADAFALDLCKHSEPYQLVVARMPRLDNLAATLTELQKRTAAAAGRFPTGLDQYAILQVPNLNWRLEHHFRELEGKRALNQAIRGMTLETAFQMVRFKLDRSGAEVRSEARIEYKSDQRGGPFDFDRPFLIVMQKRGAEYPFFVMWVDNAELLCKHD